MLVDDDVDFLYELQEALALCGYIPVPVTNGADALKTARRIRPSVILLDYKLGKENGFKIAGRIRKDQATARIPIIMMSGCFNGAQQDASLAPSNINIYLNKPFTQRDVVRGILAVLAEKEEGKEKKKDFNLLQHLLLEEKNGSQ